ncbi:hypothetical protein [Streptomyces mayteni]
MDGPWDAEGAATEASGPADAEAPSAVDPAAEELLGRADAALRGAASYTVYASYEGPGLSSTMAIAFGRDERCAGTMESAEDGLEGGVEVRRDGDDLWVRFSTGMLAALLDEDGVEALADHFIHGSVDDPRLSDLASFCDREESVENLLWPHQIMDGIELTALTIEESNDHAGTPVVAVRREDTEETGTGSVTSTTLIATEGEPYPRLLTMELESDAYGLGRLAVEYDGFGAEPPFERPDAGSVLEADELGGALGDIQL